MGTAHWAAPVWQFRQMYVAGQAGDDSTLS